ncbi:hypothetical protein QJS66_02550 [Kocuria rhizophila]|nr:hypothetical protein QJS66_02550 [Kocuria rhizophila]
MPEVLMVKRGRTRREGERETRDAYALLHGPGWPNGGTRAEGREVALAVAHEPTGKKISATNDRLYHQRRAGRRGRVVVLVWLLGAAGWSIPEVAYHVHCPASGDGPPARRQAHPFDQTRTVSEVVTMPQSGDRGPGGRGGRKGGPGSGSGRGSSAVDETENRTLHHP